MLVQYLRMIVICITRFPIKLSRKAAFASKFCSQYEISDSPDIRLMRVAGPEVVRRMIRLMYCKLITAPNDLLLQRVPPESGNALNGHVGFWALDSCEVLLAGSMWKSYLRVTSKNQRCVQIFVYICV